MLEKVYKCNLCHEQREPQAMMGLFFADLYTFTLCDARETDGSHICMRCLGQLERQLAHKPAVVVRGTTTVE